MYTYNHLPAMLSTNSFAYGKIILAPRQPQMDNVCSSLYERKNMHKKLANSISFVSLWLVSLLLFLSACATTGSTNNATPTAQGQTIPIPCATHSSNPV